MGTPGEADPSAPGEGGATPSAPRPDLYGLYEEGRRLLEAGDPAGAARALERAVAEEPGAAQLRELLGRAYFAQARLDAAREQFEAGLAVDPNEPWLHWGVGRAHERAGALDAARRSYRLAVALSEHPDYREALERVERRITMRDR